MSARAVTHRNRFLAQRDGVAVDGAQAMYSNLARSGWPIPNSGAPARRMHAAKGTANSRQTRAPCDGQSVPSRRASAAPRDRHRVPGCTVVPGFRVHAAISSSVDATHRTPTHFCLRRCSAAHPPLHTWRRCARCIRHRRCLACPCTRTGIPSARVRIPCTPCRRCVRLRPSHTRSTARACTVRRRRRRSCQHRALLPMPYPLSLRYTTSFTRTRARTHSHARAYTHTHTRALSLSLSTKQTPIGGRRKAGREGVEAGAREEKKKHYVPKQAIKQAVA